MTRIFATQHRIIPPELESGSEDNKKKIVANDVFRKFSIKCNPFDGPSGSALIELGNTKVICTVNGPKEQANDATMEGVLNVVVHGMSSSLKYTIETTLSSVVCLKKLARTTVDIELHALSDDGGVLAASIMAAGVAISSAKIEMFDTLLACHLLICSQTADLILDPNGDEIRDNVGRSASLTLIVIPSLDQVVCLDVQGPVKQAVLRRAIKFGFDNCKKLFPIVSKALTSSLTDLDSELPI